MTSIHKCCIRGCTGNNDNSRLFEITKSCDYKIWVQLIKPFVDFDVESVSHNYIKRRCVCIRHFEKRFLNGTKRLSKSFPTLFTEEEMLSGKPRVNVQIAGSIYQSTKEPVFHDHSYSSLSRNFEVNVTHPPDETQNKGQSKNDINIEIKHATVGTLASDEMQNKGQSNNMDIEIQNSNAGTLASDTDKTRNEEQTNRDIDLEIFTEVLEPDETQYEGQIDEAENIDMKVTFGAVKLAMPSDEPQQYAIVAQLDENGEVLYEEIVDTDDLKMDEEETFYSKEADKQNGDSSKDEINEVLNEDILELDDIITNKEDPPDYQKCDEINAGTPEIIASKSSVFSWDQTYELVPQTDDNCKILDEDIQDTDEIMMYEEDTADPDKSAKRNDNTTKETEADCHPETLEHGGFECNCCTRPIVGYRYSCLQCDDYDLCSACESRGFHALHYVLRVPGPRSHEEVQSMLQVIRRHLFQNNILLNSDVNRTPFPEDSIKLEPKEEVEEVDPFKNVVQPTSDSPLFEQANTLGDTSHEEFLEPGVESTTDCNLQEETHIPDKLKPQNSLECHEEFTTDLLSDSIQSSFILNVQYTDNEESATHIPLENNIIKLTLSQGPTIFPQKRNTHYTDDLGTRSATNLTPKNVATKSYWPIRILPKIESDKKPAINMPSGKILSNSALRSRQTHFSHKRKAEHQIPENYSTHHFVKKKLKVLEYGELLGLLENKKLSESDKYSSRVAKPTAKKKM